MFSSSSVVVRNPDYAAAPPVQFGHVTVDIQPCAIPARCVDDDEVPKSIVCDRRGQLYRKRVWQRQQGLFQWRLRGVVALFVHKLLGQ